MKAIFSTVLILFLLGVFTVPLDAVLVKANSTTTVVVPDNYATISAAIQHASQGDTVFVKSGIYHENPVISKSLSMIGENSTSTIVIGSGGVVGDSVFTVLAGNVEISGFTIESLNYSEPSDYAIGVNVGADNCSITNDNIVNTYIGVYVGGSGNFCGGKSSIIISQNNISANIENGIRFYGGSSNVISGNNINANNGSAIALDGYSNMVFRNNIKNNKGGIGLGSSDSVIFGNNITGNRDWGLYFETYNNIISNNYVADSEWGVYLSPVFAPSNNKFYHNDFVDNDFPVYTGSPYNSQIWDNGYPSGGNYWSSYNGVDVKTGPYQNVSGSDGIGDTPYVLGANNTDRYPLISPFNIFATESPPSLPVIANQNGALWHFDEVEPNGVTPDALGQNPAVLVALTGNFSGPPEPTLVDGKFGKALKFDFPQYMWAAESPSLNIAGSITIEAWIYVEALENTTFNNIVIYAVPALGYEARVYGLSINGLSPPNATSGPPGALCGYVFTSTGYNEIVTVDSVVSLNKWTHVVFTRSLATSMHIYVDGKEEKVMVTSGVQNPTGSIKEGTDLYFGHDFGGIMDEVRISNVAVEPQSTAFWMLGWFWIAVAAGGVILFGVIYFLRKRKTQTGALALESHG
jgi:nitrous oxidase accessory protein NosD